MFVADIEQNVGFTSSGPILPVLTKRAAVYSFNRGRFMTMRELFLSQGHPAHDIGDPGMATGFPLKVFDALGPFKLQELLGNSLHVATMGLWLIYMLSQCVATDDLDYNFNFVAEAALAGGDLVCDAESGSSDAEAL